LKEKATLKIHVMICSGCSNFSRQMHLLREFAHAYTQGDDSKVKHEPGADPGDDSQKS
jgi:hypothetical protein